ncbi:MAG: 30S ribosomal protein S9 [Nitrospinota bacterium]|nr:30S ribosomal protein S9 [Nitrospinota bacterium]
MAKGLVDGRAYATGRRKTASCRVWVKPGSGVIKVNRQELGAYFKRPTSEMLVKQPLTIVDGLTKYDVTATVCGSGLNSQAGAVRHGIARALLKLDPGFRLPLKKKGLLTRDPRMKERKKPGQPGARKKYQFSKR